MKRICVFSDGTWSTPDGPSQSNIIKLFRATLKEADGVKQVVFYDSGLGTVGGRVDFLIGGAFGAGIDVNIKQLYTFIASVYEEGDEIYMFGYSRGAYTVRSLAGMINDCGIIRTGNMYKINEAYELYRSNKSADDPELVEFREKNGGQVKITLLACFDTVGALGIPEHYPFQSFFNRRYQFHDTVLSNNIENAIHMLSIDEDNPYFKPTPMTSHPDVDNQLTQTYFWGKHGGVGGGAEDESECGQITLRFLVDEMKKRNLGLAFDMEKIPEISNSVCMKEEHKKGWLFAVLHFFLGKYVRPIDDIQNINEYAVNRYKSVESWRPAALQRLEKDILE